MAALVLDVCALKTMGFDFTALFNPLNLSSKKAVVSLLVIDVMKTMQTDDGDE